MACLGCGLVECSNNLPALLGLRQRLGFASAKLKKSMAEERIDAAPENHILFLHGKYEVAVVVFPTFPD